MGEMNERELEQVSGGAKADAEITEWIKRHCTPCGSYSSCSYATKLLYANRAVLHAKKGAEYSCPYKR